MIVFYYSILCTSGTNILEQILESDPNAQLSLSTILHAPGSDHTFAYYCCIYFTAQLDAVVNVYSFPDKS